jgi:hypothetical protein
VGVARANTLFSLKHCVTHNTNVQHRLRASGMRHELDAFNWHVNTFLKGEERLFLHALNPEVVSVQIRR